MSVSFKQILYADTLDELLATTTADDGQLAYAINVKQYMRYNSSLAKWQSSDRIVVKRSTVVVDAKVLGSTKILTLENIPQNFYPIQVVPRVSNISSVLTPPSLTIGSNSPTFDNIATTSIIDNLISALNSGSGAPKSASQSPPLPANTEIYARVSGVALATNYKLMFDLVGYYES